MTVLTLYRAPRRIVRKLIKPLALWLNAWCYKRAEQEIDRLRTLRDDAERSEIVEYRHQIKLEMKRRAIGGW